MKAIIFDFDGVIHDTFEIAFKIHKQIHPENTKEDYRAFFDGNVFKKINKKQTLKDKQFFRKHEFEAFQKLEIEKETKQELKQLKEKYELYIISSNSIKNLKYYFENNNLSTLFTEILAEETHQSKVEKFKILFKRYKLNKNNCVFVSDTLGDILEAKKVGVKTIAVDFGFHQKERLKKGNPFKIVSKFKEIREIIEKL